MKLKFAMLLVAMTLAISGNAVAQDQPIAWSSLTEEQQQVLGPHAGEWDSLGRIARRNSRQVHVVLPRCRTMNARPRGDVSRLGENCPSSSAR